MITGAGIGGLVLAVGLLKKGFDVHVFERDLTAIRGEGKYRGPIQVQSNALAALEALDAQVAEEVLAEGCITGDRVNGLVDGVSGKWYVKFDTFHPAVEKGLPVTRVVSRVTLQAILAEACIRVAGEGVIQNNVHIVDYEEKVDDTGVKRVWAICEDGRRFEGDLLIGADGIWSKVRRKLIGKTEPSYSQYTCYTGIADFTPPDIDTVGYRVFLGNGKYFVSSDVGGGKMQWYGFHKECAGGKDPEGRKKARLLDIFGHWTDMVTDLIRATPEDDVLRRDIFDRPPIFKWTQGRVALLGDSAHAMQPNLGQGGCMAIEDGYCLATDLASAVEEARERGSALDIERVLQGYQAKRLLRASTIHGLAGMAAIMASTYKAHLGEGLGPLSWITKFRVPHPGRVGGYFAMNLTMPTMLGWVLGGNVSALSRSARVPFCRVSDKPKAFCESDFRLFLRDDAALLRAANAHWLLVPSTHASAAAAEQSDALDAAAASGNGQVHVHGLRIALPAAAVEIVADGLLVGRSAGADLVIDHAEVAPEHVRLERNSTGSYHVTALASPSAAWLNGRQLEPGHASMLCPGDELELGTRGHPDTSFRVKMVHASVWRQLGAGNGHGGPGGGPAGGNGAANGVRASNEVGSRAVHAAVVGEPSLV
ncbi:hypothetical protein WJX81_001154 [Elliptochloris bilobata]|uniref:Zeaxanthin epoxidase, chloroplastic n=1 Tax=Elliptochloris bilobata TaxID=381761 RepID=A0AAW1SDF7_9CHLO